MGICRVYSDLGVSGTSTKRSGFQDMIEDCKKGKIDLILTKSISRFARNTVDLLETVCWLKSIGGAFNLKKRRLIPYPMMAS
ncbi:recombinase family protein [Lactococcus formosensis]|nr:recombinase family protein [Lactococcus formosensis]MDG6143951.1 recombinase family protein [Lactococcus formosensis]MDG6156419.1 recombinase family protein [Lactococcus formosensis]